MTLKVNFKIILHKKKNHFKETKNDLYPMYGNKYVNK